MKTVILCGGQGTRLREFTEVQPKPMVAVGGHPILWHIMKHYAHHGFPEFVLCLGYKGHVIKDYFLNYEAMSRDFTVRLGKDREVSLDDRREDGEDWTVTLTGTGESDMTGSRLRQAARWLDEGETFALTYGDGVSDVDLKAALAFHRSHGKLATVTGVRPPSHFGRLVCDGQNVVAFNEKPQVGGSLVNGGFFFFEWSFLEYLDDDATCILERKPLERCAADGQLCVYPHSGFWHCMDNLRDWQTLQRMWDDGSHPWVTW